MNYREQLYRAHIERVRRIEAAGAEFARVQELKKARAAIEEKLAEAKLVLVPVEPPPPPAPNTNPEFGRINPAFGRSLLLAIARIACNELGQADTSQALWSRNRHLLFVRPRQLTIYVMRHLIGMSLSRIGRLLSYDHTTILHACTAVKRRVAADAGYRAQFERVEIAVRELLADHGINVDTPQETEQ